MHKVKINNQELGTLVQQFFNETIHQRGKWVGKELPQIHRIFPRDIIAMFRIWYRAHRDADARVVIDDEQFIECFKSSLREANFRWREPESKSEYNLSQGDYKFLFSSLRLTRQGLGTYMEILPEEH